MGYVVIVILELVIIILRLCGFMRILVCLLLMIVWVRILCGCLISFWGMYCVFGLSVFLWCYGCCVVG